MSPRFRHGPMVLIAGDGIKPRRRALVALVLTRCASCGGNIHAGDLFTQGLAPDAGAAVCRTCRPWRDLVVRPRWLPPPDPDDVRTLELDTRYANSLYRGNWTVGMLRAATDEDILATRNVGVRGLIAVRDALAGRRPAEPPGAPAWTVIA